MNINEMTFNVPKRGGHYDNRHKTDDITFTIQRGGGKTTSAISITFRNDVEEIISPTMGRIAFLFVGSRLYFKENVSGYKILQYQNKDGSIRKHMRFVYREFGYTTEYMEEFIGDYDLQYDKREQLYYIDNNCVRR